MKPLRQRGLIALQARSNSMMSSAVIICGASERDIRNRYGWPGSRIETSPAASNAPRSARMRLAAARSSKVARSTRPPDVLMTAPENVWRSKAWMPALAFTKSLRQARDSWACGLLQAYGLGKELRLRHHRRGFGRLRAGQPADRGSRHQCAGARGRRLGPRS